MQGAGVGEQGRAAVAGIAVLATALLACGGGGMPRQLEEPKQRNVSFVYGYLDMSDAPTGLDWVELKQLDPPTEEPYYGTRLDDGVFYLETLPPGSYMVSAFGAGATFFKRATIYQLGRQGAPIRLVIKSPGIYYVGSWKITETDTGFFEPDQFDIHRIGTPTEREVLERVLVHAEGTWWQKSLGEHAKRLP
jgi:hypothetical protein